MENWKHIVLLVAGGQGLLLSLALMVSGWRKRKPAMYLGLVLMVGAVELLNAWAMTVHYHGRPGAFPFWIAGSYLLVPPALWLFFQSGQPGKLFRNRLWWWLPAIIEITLEFSGYYIRLYTGRQIAFFSSGAWFAVTEVLPLAAMCVVLIICIFHNSSNNGAERRRFQERQFFLVVFTALTFLWAIESLLRVDVFSLTEALLCALLFLLGYIVYFRPLFFEPVVAEKNKVASDAFAGYDEGKAVQALQQLFNQQKFHRRSRLTVEEVGQELGLPHRYISFLINHVHQSNFNHYVNHFRVQEVMERMKDPGEQQKTLLGIALDSGFSSKSSFNQAFKSITGETPSACLARYKAIVPES